MCEKINVLLIPLIKGCFKKNAGFERAEKKIYFRTKTKKIIPFDSGDLED